MVTFPPCKINLGLHVVGKRADGYHDIETCFYPVPWTDILEIIPADTFEFTQSGIEIPGQVEDNLCVKAFQLFRKEFGIGNVKIHLHKIVPIGAGLGGGSSDAAHCLMLLNSIFNNAVPDDTLMHYASTLGSDCSFFISNKPMLGTGRGNELHHTAVDLTGKTLVIVCPPIHVSTAEAYASVKPGKPEIPLRDILEQESIIYWKEKLVNDFEESVFKKFPEIRRIKENLYDGGALYASMSGSGSSVFGIFENNVPDMRLFSGHTTWSGVLVR